MNPYHFSFYQFLRKTINMPCHNLKKILSLLSLKVMTITCHGQTTIIVVVLLLVLLSSLIYIVHLRFECQLTISFIVFHHAKKRFEAALRI